jgi:hypothetical protein
MTLLLSFHDWSRHKGIEPVLILKNWRELIAVTVIFLVVPDRLYGLENLLIGKGKADQ